MKKMYLLLLILLPIGAFSQSGQFRQSRQLKATVAIDLMTDQLQLQEKSSDLIDGVTLKNGEITIDYHLPQKSGILQAASSYRASLSVSQDGRSIRLLPEYLLGTDRTIRKEGPQQIIWSHLLPTFIDLKGQLDLVITLDEWVDCTILQQELALNARLSKWQKAGFITGGSLVLGGGTLILISDSVYDKYKRGPTAEAVEDEYLRANDLLDSGVIMVIGGVALLTADLISVLIKKRGTREAQSIIRELCAPAKSFGVRPSLTMPGVGFPAGCVGIKLTYSFPSQSL